MTGFLDAAGHSPGNPRDRIRPMIESLRHRGPDGDGIWLGQGVALGHRSLSILNLSPAGAQPMLTGGNKIEVAMSTEGRLLVHERPEHVPAAYKLRAEDIQWPMMTGLLNRMVRKSGTNT
ncbi:hypothetical protein [Aurantimonas coralicida]